MLNKTSSIKRITLLVSVFAVFVVLGLSDLADARSSSGGRSMGGSRSGSGGSPSKSFGSPSSPSGSGSFSPSSPLSGGGGSSFLRGVGGGIVGGMIGNMIFGGSGHAGGMGGVDRSGIGIFELLILGGLGFFIYKRFINPKSPVSPFNSFSTGNFPPAGFQAPPAAPPMASASPETGFNMIKQSDKIKQP